MRKLLLLALSAVAFAACSGNGVKIRTDGGTLLLKPLADNAVRVVEAGSLEVPVLEELVYTEKTTAPKYSVKKTDDGMIMTLPSISVKYDKMSGTLSFFNADGSLILKEASRRLLESSVDDVPCYDVTESFESPEDEHLYGTGQFQDGYLDILGRFGIDAWWFDATEPENDDIAGRKVGKDGIPGDFYRNVYPLKVNSTMYAGLKTLSDDEPVILTRSAFSGIQNMVS